MVVSPNLLNLVIMHKLLRHFKKDRFQTPKYGTSKCGNHVPYGSKAERKSRNNHKNRRLLAQ